MMIRRNCVTTVTTVTTVLFATLSLLAVVGFCDTAQGQTVLYFSINSSTPSIAAPTLNFTVPSGVTGSLQMMVTSNNATTVAINTNNTPPYWSGAPSWLTVTANQNPPNTPVTLTFKANASNLNTGFMQTATIGVGISGQPVSTFTKVTVNLTVGTGTTSALSASPSSLSFTGLQGSLVGSPTQIPVQISTTDIPALDYTLNVSTNDGNNWLQVSPACNSENSLTPCVAGGTGFNVSVDPSAPNLVASITPYQGTITAVSTSTSDYVAIPVTFTLSLNSSLTVTPSAPPSFLYQIGGSGPQPPLQTLEVTTSGGLVPFNDQVTQTQGGTWLVPNISGSTASTSPTPIQLSIISGGIPTIPGKYTDVFTVAPTNGAPAVPVDVSLVVTANPLLQLANNALGFSAQFGSGSTSVQQINLFSTGGAVGFAITQDSTAAWLRASAVGNVTTASSATPATINFAVNPSGLAAGTYTGTIQISPTNGDQYSLPVTVTLTVSSTSQLTVGPPLLHFSWETSQPYPGSQNVQIGSVGQSVSFTISVPATTVTANCPANWLEIGIPTAFATPATLPIGVITSGMSPGFCSGTVVITPASGSNAGPLNIPVTVDVSNSALLNVSFPLDFGVQTVAQGAAPTTSQIFLTSTDPNTQVQFTSNSNTSWLSVAPTALTYTPQNLQVIVSPGQLTPSTYPGTITISSTSLPSGGMNIPYTLTVTPDVSVSVSPSGTIPFTQPQGGPVPQSQSLTLTSTGGSSQYSAQVIPVTGGNWLQINFSSSASGTINPTGNVGLSINSLVANSLSSGIYTSQISFAFPGTVTASATVTVTLTVTAQGISVSPASLAFTYQSGGTAPASQTLNVTSTGGAENFTANASSTGNWLSIDTSNASTPKTINVSINPQNIPASSAGGVPLTGTVSIQPVGPVVGGSNPVVINVTLTVMVSQAPQPATIKNSASLAFGAIAPGEFITIQGTNLGPATPAAGTSFSLNSQGGVNSTLAGVQVMFGSFPGTPTYVSSTVINVVAPAEIAGLTSTNISVIYQGIQSAAIPQQVVPVAPAIFTFNATGSGQAVAGNVTGPTAGTDNGPSSGVPISGGTLSTSPVAEGSYIFVYATGGGVTNPAGPTGSVNSAINLMPIANWTATSGTVTATVGGVPAKVSFAGAAPGVINGVYQFDIQVPTGVTGPALPIAITVDGVTSPAGPTIAVQ